MTVLSEALNCTSIGLGLMLFYSLTTGKWKLQCTSTILQSLEQDLVTYQVLLRSMVSYQVLLCSMVLEVHQCVELSL